MFKYPSLKCIDQVLTTREECCQVVVSFEHGDESSGCIECRDILDWLRKYQVLKKSVLHGI